MRTQADFQFDFVLGEGKSVVEVEDGDLLIKGYASDFETDRDAEAFEPGAFARGIKQFLASNPVLCLGHDTSEKALGKVLKMLLDEKGLYIEARVDKPAPSTWAADAFEKIKRGTLRAFSVGGKFFRRDPEGGVTKIHDVDLREVSVVAVPANPRALFEVATKAFSEPRYEQLRFEFGLLEETFAALEAKAWNGSSSRFSDEQWRRSCVLDRGDSYEGKSRYALPVREPGGSLNCAAVANAKARIGQVKGCSAEQKSAAQRKLDRLSSQCSFGS